MKRLKYISSWYDRKIGPGEIWDEEIDSHLRSARLILFLISTHFFSSDYIDKKEVRLALQRHKQGTAVIVPVILRPTLLWRETAIGKFQELPKNGKAVTSWGDEEEAFFDVAQGIHETVKRLNVAGAAGSKPGRKSSGINRARRHKEAGR